MIIAGVLALGVLHGTHATRAAATVTTALARSRPAARVAAVHSAAALPGALLIADRGNDRMLLVDAQHGVLWRFPTARDLARGTHLYFNDDGFVEPGGKAIVANEEEAHTIISVNIETHVVTHLYGKPGVRGSGPNELNTPDDAYVLPDGTLTVADAYNCRILFIRNHEIVRQLGRTGACHPSLAMMLPNGDIAINDDYRDRVVIVDPKKGAIVWQYGHVGTPGTGPGFLNTPDGMDFVPLGPNRTPLWSLVHHP